MRALQYLKTSLLEESGRWVIWLPVIFSVGILLYFNLGYEPSQVSSYLPFIISSFAVLAFLRKPFWRILFIIVLLVTGGFAAAKFRTEYSAAPKIREEIKVTLSGNIEDIGYNEDILKLTLRNLRIDTLLKNQIPEKVKITVRTRVKGDIKLGDRVITDAVLMPPPPQVYPGGYNSEFHSYFKQIGATGYAIRQVVKLKWGHEENFIEQTRQEINERIINKSGIKNGGFAAALVTGDRSRIPQEDLDNLQTAGLTHLIAVSGMNIAIVVGIFFFGARFLLATSYHISETIPIQKIAALVALVAGFIYLEIAASPLSAERAFIMSSLILIAIIIDRAPTPMRSTAFAALVILAITPEALLNAGFQMSFMAVFGLIALYEFITEKFPNIYREKDYEKKSSPWRKFLYQLWFYPFMVMLTSLVAGLVTAPFAAYHFNRYSTYGLFANLIAVPVTTLFIMPSGVLAMLMMPLGLEKIGLVLMDWATEIVMLVAKFFAEIPGAYGAVKHMPASALILIVVGILWLVIWQKFWRLFGLALICVGILLSISAPRPDIIVSKTLYAINLGGDLYFSNTREGFASKTWAGAFGQTQIYSLEKGDIYNVKGKTVSFNCAPADLQIDFYENGCGQKPQSTKVYYIDNGKILSENVADSRSDRLWIK